MVDEALMLIVKDHIEIQALKVVRVGIRRWYHIHKMARLRRGCSKNLEFLSNIYSRTKEDS